MLLGKVKWFNDALGFGFIDYLEQDVFVHYTAIIADNYRTLEMGNLVNFKLIKTKKGLQAKNVLVLKEALL